jgi:acyl-coenzyme A thioesterase PaaI-like protein
MKREQLPVFPSCYFCGDENPTGFDIRYHVDMETGTAYGKVAPEAKYCGFPNILHGGLQSSFLDDIMWWPPSFLAKTSCVTVEQTTRFKAEAKLGQTFTLIGVAGKREGRKFWTSGRIEDEAGKVVAESEALYLLHSEKFFEKKIKPALNFSPCSQLMKDHFGV